jgi:type II secretory pathway component PulF
MAVGILLLLVLPTLGFALWRSRPAGGAPWRFSTALLMAAGALIALTTGLCSLAGATFLITMLSGARRSPQVRAEDLFLVAMPVGGFLLTALGIWMYRRGRARVRADEGRD